VASKFSNAGFATLIPIRSMNRAIKFYTEALGGKLLYRGEGEMKNSWASVKLGKEEFWLITPQEREKRTLAYSTFLVKDIKATVKELKGRGVKFQPAEKMSEKSRLDGPIAYDSFGAAAFFKDPEGNLLMVWQNFPPM
jgi:catechol 2,3-dioxygenase-like lactoylglutathione lyase family enzyme